MNTVEFYVFLDLRLGVQGSSFMLDLDLFIKIGCNDKNTCLHISQFTPDTYFSSNALFRRLFIKIVDAFEAKL